MNIIDIRDRSSFNLGHIPGAINIDSFELLFNTGKYLSKDKTYHIYCLSGIRSKSLVNKLNNMGYRCVNIEGGYNNYLLRK